MPPITVWVPPMIFEKTLLAFMVAHFFIKRSTPAMRSNTPIVKNNIVNTDAVIGSAKTLTSIIFNNIRKTAPVKIRLVTMRKPPMARLNLTIGRIQFHSTIARDTHAKMNNIVLSQFNIFASLIRLYRLEPKLHRHKERKERDD